MDEATSGRGRLVMLVGEPGICKTRLVHEIASIAEQRGAQIFWGSCYEQQGAPPYWPWHQPLREYVQQSETDIGVRLLLPKLFRNFTISYL